MKELSGDDYGDFVCELAGDIGEAIFKFHNDRGYSVESGIAAVHRLAVCQSTLIMLSFFLAPEDLGMGLREFCTHYGDALFKHCMDARTDPDKRQRLPTLMASH